MIRSVRIRSGDSCSTASQGLSTPRGVDDAQPLHGLEQTIDHMMIEDRIVDHEDGAGDTFGEYGRSPGQFGLMDPDRHEMRSSRACRMPPARWSSSHEPTALDSDVPEGLRDRATATTFRIT